jgi:hypothetical protein
MSTTHGGRKKGFGWRLNGNQIHIKNDDGREHVFSLSETFQIIQWLNGIFRNDWFPLANNVALLGSGEEKDGLGTAILSHSPDDITHAQGSSYLGVILEEIGVFQWNGEKRGIQWRIVKMPESVGELKQLIKDYLG